MTHFPHTPVPYILYLIYWVLTVVVIVRGWLLPTHVACVLRFWFTTTRCDITPVPVLPLLAVRYRYVRCSATLLLRRTVTCRTTLPGLLRPRHTRAAIPVYRTTV